MGCLKFPWFFPMVAYGPFYFIYFPWGFLTTAWAVGNLQRRDKGRHPRESAGPECPGAPLLQRHSAPAGS